MKELRKQRLEGGGGNPLKPKLKLARGTKSISFLFIAVSIIISAGFMQAANVYYDLDDSKIVMNEKISQTGAGQVTFSGNVDATNGLDVTTGNLTVGGSNFTVAPATGNVTTIGSIGIRESTGAAFYTYFQGGDQGADITYTLPIAVAGGAGYVLSSDASGVLSWSATAAATAHNLLDGSINQDTVASTAATGSLIIGVGTNWDDLAISATSGAVLQSNGTTATWNTVLSLAGAQTADITTAAGTAPTALVFQPGANSTDSGTGAFLTVKGGNETGTTSTGGNVVIQGGTGTSTNGVVQIGTANTSALTLGATGITTTNTGYLTSTQLLTASNGLTLTTGALNLTGTSGALALSGLTASSIDTGAANLTFTSGKFNTTATGINTTAIGATTASTGAFTTLASSGNTTLGTGASSVNVIGSTTTPGTLTLHGATTLDSTFTVSGANLTSLGGNLSFTGAAPTISASTAATNIALDAGTTGAVNIAGTSTGSINFAGGSSSTGCTITTAGVLTCTGNISGGGAGTRATGERILRGMVPIFGFDLPARTNSAAYKTVSRVLEADPFATYPAAITGATRKHKLVIRYADELADGTSSWSICAAATADGSCAETFTVPYSTRTLADGSTTATGIQTTVTSLVVASTTNFNVDSWIFVNNAATDYWARITAVPDATHLTVTPAVSSEAGGEPVTEYTTNIDKGLVEITADLTIPAYPWRLAVKTDGTNHIQVYEISFAAYDQVD